jgi:hypothetical protein
MLNAGGYGHHGPGSRLPHRSRWVSLPPLPPLPPLAPLATRLRPPATT